VAAVPRPISSVVANYAHRQAGASRAKRGAAAGRPGNVNGGLKIGLFIL